MVPPFVFQEDAEDPADGPEPPGQTPKAKENGHG